MSPKIFNIRLEPYQVVYYPGHPINGNVILSIDEPMKMRAIYMVLVGKGAVSWTETEETGTGDDRRSTTVTYSNSEDYFHHKVALHNCGNSLQDSGYLPPGDHSFSFSYILPLYLPSSFEGSDGHVRYKAKAIIDRPWAFNKEVEEPFCVNSVVDLNLNTMALLGISGDNSKEICCMCCAGGTLNLQAQLPRSGFVPGEVIPLNVEIHNGSSDKVKVITKLCQTIKFIATSKSREETKVLYEVIIGEVSGNNTETLTPNLTIPSIPPTNLGMGCRIIEIRYLLQIIVKTSGMSFSLKQDMPIIIGTIPVLTHYNMPANTMATAPPMKY